MTARPLIETSVKIGDSITAKRTGERFKVTDVSHNPEYGCIIEVEYIVNSRRVGLYREIFTDEFSEYEIVDWVFVE